MDDLRRAAELALEALENMSPDTDTLVEVEPHVWEYRGSLAIQALRQALAQPDLARVGEVGLWGHKREWVELTDEEIGRIEIGLRIPTCYRDTYDLSLTDFAKAVEAKLKEKNT